MPKHLDRKTKIILFDPLQKQTTPELYFSKSSWIQKKTGACREIWMMLHEVWLQEESWGTIFSSYRSKQEGVQARRQISIE